MIEGGILRQSQVGLPGHGDHSDAPFWRCERDTLRARAGGLRRLRLVEVPIVSQQLPDLFQRIGLPVRSFGAFRSHIVAMDQANVKGRVW